MQDIPYRNTDPVNFDKLSMVRQLAAGIAHEIWNPLAVIKTMMFAMRADLHSEDPRCADFDVVDKEVGQMEQVIQRLLDYIWPPDPILAPVILGQIVANVLGLLAHQALVQGVQIEVSVDPEVVILADQGQLEKVFTNLALNALQAMPEGGKLSIVARTEQVFVNLAVNALPATFEGGGDRSTAPGREGDEGSGKVGVEVADTGWGIPAELIDRIFEPFVVEGRGGVGLGLAIVQQIVERHGGQVAAHNRPEGGATFTVTLPRMEV